MPVFEGKKMRMLEIIIEVSRFVILEGFEWLSSGGALLPKVFVLWIKPHTAQRTNRGQHVAPEPKTWLSFFNPSSPPSFFYPHTFSLPPSIPLFIPRSAQQIQKLCRHSNSCRLRKLPKSLPFFFTVCSLWHSMDTVLMWEHTIGVGGWGGWKGGGKKKKRRVERWMLRGTTEQSSRAERGEEGLEVEKPGGQTYSQSAGDKVREKKKKRVRQRANTDRDGRRKTARQSCRHIKKQKTNKQRVNKERQANGTQTASRQIE